MWLVCSRKQNMQKKEKSKHQINVFNEKKSLRRYFFYANEKCGRKNNEMQKKTFLYFKMGCLYVLGAGGRILFPLQRIEKKKKIQTFIKRVRVAYGACMRCPKNINRRSRHSPSTIERNDCRMEKYILAVFVSASSNCLIEEAGDFFG